MKGITVNQHLVSSAIKSVKLLPSPLPLTHQQPNLFAYPHQKLQVVVSESENRCLVCRKHLGTL